MTREYVFEALFDLFKKSSEEQDRKNRKILAGDSRELSFYENLFIGILKESAWFDFIIRSEANRNPSLKISLLLKISLYQSFFLTSIPEHAIFSELKNLSAKKLKSKEEIAFCHAILKKLILKKDELLTLRNTAIEKLKISGEAQTDEDKALLNCSSDLLDSLTVASEDEVKNLGVKQAKRESRKRAVRSLIAMKVHEPQLNGYDLEKGDREITFEKKETFFSGLKSGSIRVQSLVNQKFCEQIARQISKSKSKPLRILEMCSGKGGKFFSTIHALGLILEKIPEIEWFCCDSSTYQLEKIKEVLPVFHKRYPQVKVHLIQEDWASDKVSFLEAFSCDFVLLDAPCTGFGTLAKLPQISFLRGDKAYANAKQRSYLQTKLIEQGIKYLKKTASSFYYSVCTLTHPETVEMKKLLEKTEHQLNETKTMWPFEEKGLDEGLFWTAIHRE